MDSNDGFTRIFGFYVCFTAAYGHYGAMHHVSYFLSILS